jgi:23S rRNA pseudouridine2605 synthase
MDKKTLRLHAFLARCGVASRRASEKMILEGSICVNGATITTLGSLVRDGDVVTVHGKVVSPKIDRVYLLLNKPKGYLCTNKDEKGRPTIFDLLRHDYGHRRLFSIGRLDMYSTGLIVVTDDGDFASLIGHPSSNIEKEYVITSSIPFSDEPINAFIQGITIGGVHYQARSASRISAREVAITIIEGRNREIRNVFELFKVPIQSLERIRIGNITRGSLEVGQVRSLLPTERNDLSRSAEQHLES